MLTAYRFLTAQVLNQKVPKQNICHRLLRPIQTSHILLKKYTGVERDCKKLKFFPIFHSDHLLQVTAYLQRSLIVTLQRKRFCSISVPDKLWASRRLQARIWRNLELVSGLPGRPPREVRRSTGTGNPEAWSCCLLGSQNRFEPVWQQLTKIFSNDFHSHMTRLKYYSSGKSPKNTCP